MDKYEYKVKLEQIEKMAAKKDYVTAAKIADGIDWRKEKSPATLSMVADVYEYAGRLEDCYELLNMMYDRSPIGRRIVYRMAEIAIKMHNFEEAIDLYKEFVKIAPHDLNKYILKYQIYRERGSSVEEQIMILEEFKSHEYDEKWSYELACRYEDAGRIEECIEACDELILWFSEGEYVVKAMELKMKYQELTATQQEKYERRFEYMEDNAEEELLDNEENLEEENQEEFLEEPFVEEVQEETENAEELQVEEAVTEEEELPVIAGEDTPQVSMINVNKFSTINLQAELAKNLQELLAQVEVEETEEGEEKEDTQEFVPYKTVIVEEPAVEEVTIEEEFTEEAAEEEEPAEEAAEEEESVSEIVVTEEAVAEEVLQEEPEQKKLSDTEELQTEILKYLAEPQMPKMEELLRTEEDGQMTLAIGEETTLKKQITGQMTIGEILEAWEEKKRQVREQIEAAEAKKPAVLFETGEITGLLEDFIPKTPKETTPVVEDEKVAEEIVTEEAAEETLKEPVIEEVAEESIDEAAEVLPEEEKWEEVSELEDDLPQDIDFESALEAFLDEPVSEEAPVEENEPVETVEEAEAVDAVEAVEETESITEEAVKEKIGQNTAAMLDAIERALALEVAPVETAGSYLTEEQEKIFAYFTSVNGMKKQLITLLEEERNYTGKEDSREGNLIITGHPGNGKTTLAIDIVKAIQKQRKVKGAKLAKVSGDGFNKKNPEEVIAKLGGGALIIERAGSLKDETVEMLSEAMEGFTDGLLVILEDDLKEIERLMKKHEGFAAKFNRSVNIPIFSNDELVAFGKSYAEEKEYFFDDMAILALYDCIGVRQTSEHVVNITEVKEFIDDAIEHAEKKSKGFFARLSKKRIDEYGNKLLLEEDFNY